MITDYNTLQQALADYIARNDLSSQIKTFINQGEARIYRDLRVIDMEKSLSGTTSNNTLTVPTDYIVMREAYVSTSQGLQALERVDLVWLRSYYPVQTPQQAPYYFAREGLSFIFAPYPDQAYTVGGIYYARLPSLSDSNTSNWLITKNSDLIFAAAMLEAATYLMDEQGVPYWESRYQAIAAQVQAQDTKERFSGSPIAIKAA